jgi:hypothetical protein
MLMNLCGNKARATADFYNVEGFGETSVTGTTSVGVPITAVVAAATSVVGTGAAARSFRVAAAFLAAALPLLV